MVPKTPTGLDAEVPPTDPFFGSREHRTQVNRAIKDRLLGPNGEFEHILASQRREDDFQRRQRDMPTQKQGYQAPTWVKEDSGRHQKQRVGSDMLPPVQPTSYQIPRGPSSPSRRNKSHGNGSTPPPSPPTTHLRRRPPFFTSPRSHRGISKPSSPPRPRTQTSPLPSLPSTPLRPPISPHHHHSPQTPQSSALPPIPSTKPGAAPLPLSRLSSSAEDINWAPLPAYPPNALPDEVLALIDAEIEIYEISELYEESVGRKLLAKYNRGFLGMRRRVLVGMEER